MNFFNQKTPPRVGLKQIHGRMLGTNGSMSSLILG